ncbi:hypothetical protein D3C84_689030 [compost metagenome]
MRRHCRRIDPVEAQAAQHAEGQHRQQHAQAQHQHRLAQQLQAGLLRQLHPAVQADGQQQDDRQGFIERRRQLQLAFQQTGTEAEDKKQYHRVKPHRAYLRSSAGATAPAAFPPSG